MITEKRIAELKKKRKILGVMRDLYEILEGDNRLFEFSETTSKDGLNAIQETIWSLEEEIFEKRRLYKRRVK